MITFWPISMIKVTVCRCQRSKGDDCCGVDYARVFALRHRLVNRCLEALLVDHQTRGGQTRNLPRGELQVMWLGAWLSQASDRCLIPCDALGDELQRIERSHDAELTRLAPLNRVSRAYGHASSNREERHQATKHTQPPCPNRHENHFH